MSYMSMKRKFKYLTDNRVVWRRDPTTDIPDEETKEYLFYKNGTYQAYNLFRSKAKITTYRSLKWHMLTLWYLNPNWDEHDAMDVAMYITNKDNGFITFNINRWNTARLIDDLSVVDFENPKAAAVVEQPGTHLGVIAQEIQEVLPDLVEEMTTGVLTVNPDNMTWYLVNAVKELSAEIEQLKSQINN